VAHRGYLLYREGRLREAAILFQGLIVIDPENAYCRRTLAAISIRLGQHWLAIRHLSMIIARDRLDADAIAARCEALMAAGDFTAARRDLDSLAALPAGAENGRRLRLQLSQQSEFVSGAAAPQLPAGQPR
jgi:tetratricopeptide (TPR) repeat protein